MERVNLCLSEHLYSLHIEKKTHPLYLTGYDAQNNRVQITLSDPEVQNNPEANKTVILKIDPNAQTAIVEEVHIGNKQVEPDDLQALDILDRMRLIPGYEEENEQVAYSRANGKSVTNILPPPPNNK